MTHFLSYCTCQDFLYIKEVLLAVFGGAGRALIHCTFRLSLGRVLYLLSHRLLFFSNTSHSRKTLLPGNGAFRSALPWEKTNGCIFGFVPWQYAYDKCTRSGEGSLCGEPPSV